MLGLSRKVNKPIDLNPKVKQGEKEPEPNLAMNERKVTDFEFLTAANVTSIKAFADSVTDRYPFIYSEDAVTGPYRYCRMIQPIQFTEVLANIWSCQITLHELL